MPTNAGWNPNPNYNPAPKPAGGWRPFGYQQPGEREGAQVELPVVEPQSYTGYWSNPQTIGQAYMMLQSKPRDAVLPNWMTPELQDTIKTAADWYTRKSGTADWQAWQPLPTDDPLMFALAQMPDPPAEYRLPPETGGAKLAAAVPSAPQAVQGEPTYARYGLTKAQWNNLSTGQRNELRFFGSGSGYQGAAIGASAGMLGGPTGMLQGAILGGVFGTLAEKLPWLQTAFAILNKGYEIPRNVKGSMDLLGAAVGGGQGISMQDVMENPRNVWSASGLTYMSNRRVVGSPAAAYLARNEPQEVLDIETHLPRMVPAEQIGTAALVEAFDRLNRGESLDSITKEYTNRYGYEGQMNELLGAMLIDFLPLVGPAETQITAKLGKLGGFSPEFVKTIGSSEGMFRGLKEYKSLQIPFEKFNKFNAFEKAVYGGWTPEGVSKKLLIEPPPTNPIAKAWRYTTHLTPEYRATESMQTGASNFIGVLDRTMEGTDAFEADKILNNVAKTPLETAKKLNMASLEGPDGQMLPLALREVAHETRALLETYTNNTPLVDDLNKVAIALKQTPEELVKTFAKNGEAGLDGIMRRAVEGGTETTLDKLKVLKKVFVDQKNPYSPDMLWGDWIKTVKDGMIDWGTTYFSIKEDPAWLKFSNDWKNAQGLLMLDFSPTYFLQNSIDNTFKLLQEGLLGFSSEKSHKEFFDRFGVKSPRYDESWGGEQAELLQGIQVKKGKSGKIGGAISRLRKSPLAFASRLSGRSEKWAGNQALYNGTVKAWDRIWRPGFGFDRLVGSDIERVLGRETAQFVERAVQSGMSRSEIEKSIFSERVRYTPREVISDVGRELGISDSDLAHIERTFGIADTVEEWLKVADTPEKQRQAFDKVRKLVQDKLDDVQADAIRMRIEKNKQILSGEGTLGIVEPLAVEGVDYALYRITDFDELGHVFEQRNLLETDTFYKLLDSTKRNISRRWERIRQSSMATYKGIADGLGADDPTSLRIQTILKDKADNIESFYKAQDEGIDGLKKMKGKPPEEVDAAWYAHNKRMTELANKMHTDDLTIQERLHNEIVLLMTSQFGEDAGKAAEAYLVGMRGDYDGLYKSMEQHRQSLQGKSVRERDAAWPKYLNETHKPELNAMGNKNWKAGVELYKSLTEQIPVKDTPVDRPSEKFVKQAVEQTAQYKLNNVRRIAAEFGIASAKKDGSPDTGFNRHILNIVNSEKYGGTKGQYAKIEDIPEDVLWERLLKREEDAQYERSVPFDQLPEKVKRTVIERALREQGEIDTQEVIAQRKLYDPQTGEEVQPYTIPYDEAEVLARARELEMANAKAANEEYARVLKVEAEEAQPAGTPDAVGVMPPETIKGLYPPDTAKFLEDGAMEVVYRMIGKMEDKLIGPEALKPPSMKGLSAEQNKALRLSLERIYGQLSDSKLMATRFGEIGRDAALLNYNRRYGIDNLLNMVMPYQFWYTRSAMNWALRAIERPSWLANYARIRATQDKLAGEQEGFPQRLRGKVQIPLEKIPFLPSWMGDSVWIDPMHLVFGFEQMMSQVVKPMMRDENNRMKMAKSLIAQQLKDETISSTEAEQATGTMQGAIWEEALADANTLINAEVAGPMDMVNAMTSFSWPLQMAYQALVRRTPEKISSTPLERTISGATALLTDYPGGVNVGGWLRKAVNLPERDFLYNYYVERELANMAAEQPEMTKDIQLAMVDQGGELWDEAMRRVGKQQALRNFASTLWMDFFPEGEQKQRALASEFYTAMDNGTAAQFFDEHPEYQARMTLTNWDDPGERMKRYLISSIWDARGQADTLTRNAIDDQLGSLYEDAFLNKETRSYESLDVNTLAQWARTWKGAMPETAPEVAALPVDLPEASVTSGYENYMSTRQAIFPNIDLLQKMYFGLSEGAQDKFLQKYPEVSRYWEWRDRLMAGNPELIPYMISEDNALASAPANIQQGAIAYRAERASLYPGIYMVQNEYYARNKDRSYLNQHPELKDYWDWNRAYKVAHPELEPYLWQSKETQNKRTVDVDLASMTDRYPTLSGHLKLVPVGMKLTTGDVAMMRVIYERIQPSLTFNEWLNIQGINQY